MEQEQENALEAIFSIKTMLMAQQQQLLLLQQSVSLLDNKLNVSVLKNILDSVQKLESASQPAKSVGKVAIQPELVVQPPKPAPRQNIKVSGVLQDDESARPLTIVDVKIMDVNNRIIKQTKTNRAGEWMCFLPPGRYTAEFTADGMQSDFRVFDLIAGQSEVEVS